MCAAASNLVSDHELTERFASVSSWCIVVRRLRFHTVCLGSIGAKPSCMHACPGHRHMRLALACTPTSQPRWLIVHVPSLNSYPALLCPTHRVHCHAHAPLQRTATLPLCLKTRAVYCPCAPVRRLQPISTVPHHAICHAMQHATDTS